MLLLLTNIPCWEDKSNILACECPLNPVSIFFRTEFGIKTSLEGFKKSALWAFLTQHDNDPALN